MTKLRKASAGKRAAQDLRKLEPEEKANRSAGHVGVAGFYVPTNNVLNVFLQNSKPDSAGSFPATGWDIVALRSA